MKCEWCARDFPEERLCGYEANGQVVYRHLCPGCSYCLHAGGPRVDDPFVCRKDQVEQVTRAFFSTLTPHP